MIGGNAITQRQARILFTLLEAQWTLWVKTKGWAVFASEGYVKDTDDRDGDYDGPHKNGGAHYLGTGRDYNLVVGGTWDESGTIYTGGRVITNGGTPEWREAGEYWEKMHNLCRWGGRFNDDNHIGILFNGRA